MIRRLAVGVLLFVLAGLLVGCDTTADKSARAKVAANRELATRKAVVVKRPIADVRVKSVSVVGRGRGAAFVVRYVNKGSVALNDLPVNVGVSRGGARKVLNQRRGLEYFLTHISAAAPGVEGVWVAPLGKRVPRGKPFAVIGTPTMPQSGAATVPVVSVSGVSAARGKVTGTVKNTTGVPQYVILVYAVARRGSRDVAAARARLTKFETGEQQIFKTPLIGRPGQANPTTQATPAITP